MRIPENRFRFSGKIALVSTLKPKDRNNQLMKKWLFEEEADEKKNTNFIHF